jgi:hypothetical protein
VSQIFAVEVKKDQITDAVIGMMIDIGNDLEQIFSVMGVPGGGEERQCDVKGQRVGSKEWRIVMSGSSFIDGAFVAGIGLPEVKIEQDSVIDGGDAVIDGRGADLSRISELDHPDCGGDGLHRFALVFAQKGKIIFPGPGCPIAVELDLLVMKVAGLVDIPDAGVDIGGKGGDRCRVQFFKYTVTDAYDGYYSIAGGGCPIAEVDQWNGYRVHRGPVDVKVPDIQGMDVVVLKDISFHAVQSKSGVPIIEAHGLGSLLAGKKATGKKAKG